MNENESNEDFSISRLSKQLESKMENRSVDPLANGVVNETSSDDISSEIRHSQTAIIMFYRENCPYCKRLEPLLDELAKDYQDRVVFMKGDVEHKELVSHKFEILGVPLLVAFKRGMAVSRIEGLRSYEEYDSWIESISKGLRPMQIENGPASKLSD